MSSSTRARRGGTLTVTPATTVALVSGRSLSDLRVIAEHGDDSVLLLAGSHGAEHWTPADGTRHPAAGEPTAAERAERDRLRAEAEALVAGVPGAWIEPKTFGFAVPSRTVPADVEPAVEKALAN